MHVTCVLLSSFFFFSSLVFTFLLVVTLSQLSKHHSNETTHDLHVQNRLTNNKERRRDQVSLPGNSILKEKKKKEQGKELKPLLFLQCLFFYIKEIQH